MIKKTRVRDSAIASKRKNAEEMVRRVLTSVFSQSPSQKTIEDVTEKVLKGSPQKAA